MNNSTTRFSDRVENYVKYRPGYPLSIIPYLEEKTGLNKEKIIADIGSGTGLSAELFLKNGNKVYCIEPNKEMREAGEKFLEKYKYFKSVNATAEDTLLENDSMDIIVCGQAFHWFDTEKCKVEFARILKENGYVVLIWNERNVMGSELMSDYENLLRKFGTDYDKVTQQDERVNESIKTFFGERGFNVKTIESHQDFDSEGFKGRLLSSSYVPKNNEEMLKELKALFEKHKNEGLIRFEYHTKIYTGQLK